MRKTYAALFLLVLCGTVRAQPTLTAGQYAMQWGDHYELFEFSSTISPTSGANVTWNYANLISAPWFSQDVVDPSIAAGFAYFPTATATLQWLPIGEFQRSTAAMEEHLGWYSGPFEYSLCSDPRTEMEYPFTIGSSFPIRCTVTRPEHHPAHARGYSPLHVPRMGALFSPTPPSPTACCSTGHGTMWTTTTATPTWAIPMARPTT